MNIRPAVISDIQAIRNMACLTWPEAYVHILSGKQVSYMLNMMYHPARLLKQMEKEGHLFLIAEVNASPVGFAGFSEDKPGYWKLHKIYVLPEMHGRSIGKALINEVIAITWKNGAARLSLNVNRHNKAFDFYLHNGFVKVAEADIDIGNGFFMQDYILEKDLSVR